MWCSTNMEQWTWLPEEAIPNVSGTPPACRAKLGEPGFDSSRYTRSKVTQAQSRIMSRRDGNSLDGTGGVELDAS
jgi:hypothetical protein